MDDLELDFLLHLINITMEELNYILLSAIPAAISAVLTFIFTRKKYQAETKGNEIDNVEKAVRIWRELSEDIKKQFESDILKLKNENKEMKEQMAEVLKENNNLRTQMLSLEKQLKTTTEENKKLLNQLKRANQTLKEA
jgi:septal ring factor EnvC (AmiA/AmiB activator)